MLDFEISYSGRKSKVIGPSKVTVAVINDLFDFVQVNTFLLAKDFLEQEQNRSDFPLDDYLTIVDGKIGAREESVKVFGKIEYRTKLESLVPVILDGFRFAVESSPTKTGYYQSLHVLMKNERVVAKGLFEVNAYLKGPGLVILSTDVFRIINMAPYARKLERRGSKRGIRGASIGAIINSSRKGKSRSGKQFSAPNGAYWSARRRLRTKYPALKSNIRFSFIPVSPSVAQSQNSIRSGYVFKKGKRAGGIGRPYLYPSITISPNPIAFTKNAGFTERQKT